MAACEARNNFGIPTGLYHYHVVRHDAAIAIAQAEHQVPPVVTPRRIAVQHDHDLAVARTFVEVRQRDAGSDLGALRRKGVIGESEGGHPASCV